jgi:hypothetical protein
MILIPFNYSLSYMAKEGSFEKSKRPISVEIVHVPHPPDNDSNSQIVSAGVTELNKEELNRLFQLRSLEFLSTFFSVKP